MRATFVAWLVDPMASRAAERRLVKTLNYLSAQNFR
jgi:hypothetical protein